MEFDSNKKLINILQGALKNPNEFYNEEVINYILQIIDSKYLLEPLIHLDFNNYNIHTNFWGAVCNVYIKIEYIDTFERVYSEKVLEAINNHTLKHINKTNKEFRDYLKILTEKKEAWKALLDKHNIDLIADSIYYLDKQDKKIPLSYAAFLAFKSPVEWAMLYSKENENNKWSLTPEEEMVVVNVFFDRSKSYDLKYLERQEQDLLLTLFIKCQAAIKREYILSRKLIAPTEQEEQWIGYIIGSPLICSLLKYASKEQMSFIFSETSYKILINRATLKVNVENTPEMLSNILAIAEPEQWINAYKKNGNFNLLNFFETKFKRGYARSLIKSKSYFNSTYTRVKDYVLEELEYLSPALKSAPISNEDRLKFWQTVAEIRNFELIKQVFKAINLPDECDSKNSIFYDFYRSKTIKDNDNIEYTFAEVAKIAHYEVLQSLIPDNSQQIITQVTKKKIKI